MNNFDPLSPKYDPIMRIDNHLVPKYEPILPKYEAPLQQRFSHLNSPLYGPNGLPMAGPGLRLGPPGNPVTW